MANYVYKYMDDHGRNGYFIIYDENITLTRLLDSLKKNCW